VCYLQMRNNVLPVLMLSGIFNFELRIYLELFLTPMDLPSKTRPTPQVCFDDNGIDHDGLCHILAQLLHSFHILIQVIAWHYGYNFASPGQASTSCYSARWWPFPGMRPASCWSCSTLRMVPFPFLYSFHSLTRQAVGLIDQLSRLFLEGSILKR
jgi:hypothetical protein